MSDDKQPGAAGPIAGERLAEARRLKQISLPDVARQLHLDEPRVQALEENRFDVLGAPVFAKGYLRKYAKLVGASIDDIMADYYTLNRATGAPPVVGPPRKRQRDIDPGRWLGGILLVIVLAAAAYWWLQRTPVSSPQTPAETQRPIGQFQNRRRVAEPSQPGASETAPAASDALADTEAPLPSTTPAAGREEPAATTLSSAAANTVELRLAYSGDCWTEVSDADGRRLFFDLGTAGRTVTVRGAAPLRVLIGNDDNVRLTVDGDPYPIAAADRRGNTARFSIDR